MRNVRLAGLVEACTSLRLTFGTILTYTQEKTLEKDGLKISVLPVWEWLLK